MHLVWKQMEKLVDELKRRDDMTPQEKFNAIMLAIEAAGLQRTPAEIEYLRKCLLEAEAAWKARRKMP